MVYYIYILQCIISSKVAVEFTRLRQKSARNAEQKKLPCQRGNTTMTLLVGMLKRE